MLGAPNRSKKVDFHQISLLKYILAAQNQMRMDAHPPNKIRVNQAFRNFRPFSEIWECPAGSPMNPKDRCQVW